MEGGQEEEDNGKDQLHQDHIKIWIYDDTDDAISFRLQQMIDGVKQFEKYEMVDGVKNSTFESVTLLSKKHNFIKGGFLTMVISQSDIVRS